MHPAVALVAENVVNHHRLLALLAFAVLGTVATVHTPIDHSLLVTAVAWAFIWIPTIFRAGLWSSNGSGGKKTASWAGGFLALAHVCDRAARDQEGTWSAKAFLPLLVALILDDNFVTLSGALPSYIPLDDAPSELGSGPDRKTQTRSYNLLLIVAASAGMVLATGYTTSPTAALGLCSVIFTAAGLVLFENSLKAPKDDKQAGRRGFMSANGTFSRRASLEGAKKDQHIAVLRDVAAVMTVACGLATYLMEPTITPNAFTWEPVYRQLHGNWKTLHHHRTIQQCLLMIFVTFLVNILFFLVLLQQGATRTSFLLLASVVYARLNLTTSFLSIWFTIVCISASILFLYTCSASSSATDARSSTRLRRLILGIATLSFLLAFFRFASGARHIQITSGELSTFEILPPGTLHAPVPIDTKKGHPADQLIKSAEKNFQECLNRQSKTLGQAVQEYRRRNGVHPPPHFDKWYEFATRNGVQLIDEFDTINRSLQPFWALKPSTVRARVKFALGYEENALIGMMIRDGNVVKVEGGPEWQQQATTGMMKEFIKYLPDMDLAFNVHDEPRVVVPHDQLSFLVVKARDESIPAAMKNEPRNAFSTRPADMNDGRRFEEAKTTHFNRFAHQQTWTHARLSCPPYSSARNYEDQAADNLTAYAAEPLNYVYNQSAFSDICNSPSLSNSFGFFERPNAFNIIHELVPIFSQSKISSFQDILYPSPWYWFGKVGYDEDRDTHWENKTNSLYWRGSTTGGFSRNGGWRRQHRQHVVKRLNAPDKAEIMIQASDDNDLKYDAREVERKEYQRLVDVKFSHVGQCDPGDCDAQHEFFEVTERVDGQDAWYYKHLLDMDGNAFSGRFYSFLRSKSLTYKMAVFREWHSEWLKPWVHYVPLSLIGDEYLDLVHWFSGADSKSKDKSDEAEGENKGGNGNSLGEKKAREIAERSTEWANKVLRNVDFEVWFFRLLLEYGRIIDDNRDTIGYPGP